MRGQRPETLKRVKLCGIHWVDTVGHRDDPADEPLKPLHCFSVGFVVEETKEYVKIASELIEDGTYQEVVAIPKGCIKGVKGARITLPKPLDEWGTK